MRSRSLRVRRSRSTRRRRHGASASTDLALASARTATTRTLDSTVSHRVPEAPLSISADVSRPRDGPSGRRSTDQTQGVQLAKIQALVQYWGTDYNWRKAESKLNALPQFVTAIDGLDIQFIHVRSRHPNALPLIMTHGWPGSPLELLKVIGPLTDPDSARRTCRRRVRPRAATYPGYGFSDKPEGTTWDQRR